MNKATLWQARRLATTALGALFLGAAASQALAADVTQDRLNNADKEPQNWLLPHQNYEAHSFSSLAQIHRDNVKNLKVAYTVGLGSALKGSTVLNLEYRPLVDDGFMYATDGWGQVFKIDLRSGDRGKLVWKADSAVSKDNRNRDRGGALGGNAYYHSLTDGRVVAIDRDSGQFIFDKQRARIEHPKGSVNFTKESFTMAPLVVEGKVLVGNAGGDDLTRGWLEAIDMKTGNEVWRTYTVPGPGEPGHDTWKDNNNAWMIGGAALWTTGSYDKDQKLAFYGTGNAEPMFDVEYRPGDNLYSVSLVAFDVADGKIRWHFQYTPNEGWDYDENGVHMITPVEQNGQVRKVLTHFGRNGFFYRLDGTNGSFVDATQYVEKVNWTKGIDPKTGKPLEYDPRKDVQSYLPEARALRDQGPKMYCPGTLGGVRWQPPAYSPNKKLAYSAGFDYCVEGEVKEVKSLPNSPMHDPRSPGTLRGQINPKVIEPRGLVAAMNVPLNRMVARFYHKYDNESGVLATGGGLVFTATLDGNILALNDETLQEIWRFNTGMMMKAAPISFAVNGKQYIAVVAGGEPTTNPITSVYPDLIMNQGAAVYVFTL